MTEAPGTGGSPVSTPPRRHGRHRDHTRRNRALVATAVVLAVLAAGLLTLRLRAGSEDPAFTAAGTAVASSESSAASNGEGTGAEQSGASGSTDRSGSAEPTPTAIESASGTAAGATTGSPATGPGAGAAADGGTCSVPDGRLTVAAAPELADALSALADSVRPNGCRLTVRAVDPDAVLADSGDADVWIPDSSVWLERAAAAGRAPAGRPTSIATSPVVLAVSMDAAEALKKSGTADIRTILASRGSTTPIRVGLPDPQRSAAAVGAILSARAAVTGTADARPALTWAVRSSPPRLPVNGADLLSRLSTDPDTALPASEEQVLVHNRSDPRTPAVAVYERRGGVALDYPLVALDSDPGVAAATAQLTAALTGGRGREALQQAGFRTPDGRPGPTFGSVPGIDPAVVVTAPLPALDAVDDAIRTAQLTNEPSRMLAVMDVSGSMESQVPDTGGASRMDLAKEAAARGLVLYPGSSEIGLWVFSRKLEGDSDHRELIPVGPLGATSDGRSGAERLAAAVASISAVPDGGTGLYDTVLDAVRSMRAAWDPTKVNAVLILSDGMNDDEGSISLDDLLKTLTTEQDPSRPVPVVSIAFGPDSDVQSLAAISKATGGAAYQSRDPKQVGEIFLDAVGQRLCRPGC